MKYHFLLLILLSHCIFIIPNKYIENIYSQNRIKIKEKTIVLYNFNYKNYLRYDWLHDSETRSKFISQSIRNAFEKRFLFENLQIFESNQIQDIGNIKNEGNIIYLQIDSDKFIKKNNFAYFFSILNGLSFGIIPYFQSIDFEVRINSKLFNSEENTFYFNFIEYGGLLMIPFALFSESFLDLRNKYHNSAVPEIDYMLSNSLKNINLQ
ncbi:hypothetical protein [Leptospira levettii]|uniref:hypothetical protein n=1 Tax=Leptospira levettii TaxID=2023178 RepID=UPI000C297A07|nr:hypothetical protein [Leptospira levettii]MCW7475449.1 hypothetical protein [Leptospira levettii]PJZ88731.1 hypothetical protein CH368_10325 [Leptospira levettii]